MNDILQFKGIVSDDVIDQIKQLGDQLKGKRVVHINSTKSGGGVAEILVRLIPLMQSLGIDAVWEIIQGTAPFYQCTKAMHNGMQGNSIDITAADISIYEETNRAAASKLKGLLEDADFVFIHDPQPAALINHFPNRKGKWIWRCHIDASRPYPPIWNYLKRHVELYDASVFSLVDFTKPLPHPIYLIPPSIDPCGEKNRDLPEEEIEKVLSQYGIDQEIPWLLQVSRFDHFKDPIGVIQAFRIARKFEPNLQLVLAGGGADDDPESNQVLNEIKEVAGGEPQIKILNLAADAHLAVNALQRMATIVLQKSTKEGFGLTVSEALWKERPVIGGDVGGIRLQIVDGKTGFLVQTPEGAATRIRDLLQNDGLRAKMGKSGKERVRNKFLITRQLRDYLILMLSLLKK